ncbi:unnamed protein product [Coffea canephora]|uniref:DH200=94 genomic scaffold, scaffold_1800 n=1 Tax=Coffea canephora TaxID=49390 RepID=A0A068VJC9_COFCA|nr:unnamed protein product [Coffea canephora]
MEHCCCIAFSFERTISTLVGLHLITNTNAITSLESHHCKYEAQIGETC